MKRLGQYEILRAIASGGMASVYLGRTVGVGGFERLVAIKVMLPHLAEDPGFVAMFLDEARIAAHIRHPNVVGVLDVQESEHGLFLVMDFVEGASLHAISRALSSRGGRERPQASSRGDRERPQASSRGDREQPQASSRGGRERPQTSSRWGRERPQAPARSGALGEKDEKLPLGVALRITLDMLAGLHAAHELKDKDGEPQELVHRDVSPHNLLVGLDGVARITDFGVARARTRLTMTRAGEVKGKITYMAPEQIAGGELDRRCDIFAAGIVLWELLTGQRMFAAASDEASIAYQIVTGPLTPPRAIDPALPEAIERVCLCALERDPADRHGTAAAFADALEEAASEAGVAIAGARAVGAYIAELDIAHTSDTLSPLSGVTPEIGFRGPIKLNAPSGASGAAQSGRAARATSTENETPVARAMSAEGETPVGRAASAGNTTPIARAMSAENETPVARAEQAASVENGTSATVVVGAQSKAAAPRWGRSLAVVGLLGAFVGGAVGVATVQKMSKEAAVDALPLAPSPESLAAGPPSVAATSGSTPVEPAALSSADETPLPSASAAAQPSPSMSAAAQPDDSMGAAALPDISPSAAAQPAPSASAAAEPDLSPSAAAQPAPSPNAAAHSRRSAAPKPSPSQSSSIPSSTANTVPITPRHFKPPEL